MQSKINLMSTLTIAMFRSEFQILDANVGAAFTAGHLNENATCRRIAAVELHLMQELQSKECRAICLR